MLAVLRHTSSLFIALALVSWAPSAFAQTPSAVEEDEEPVEAPPEPGEGLSRAAPQDLRRGALLVSVGSGLFAPAYGLLGPVDLSTALAPGLGFRGSLGLGLSRHVSLEVGGAYGLLSAGESCSSCSGSSYSFGVGLTYHLAQGIAFDPYASFGVNYRSMTFVDPARSKEEGAGTYTGWDFAKISLGGTYYPVSFLGIGPYLEASFGGFRLLPDGRTNGGAYTFIDFGLRVTLDPLRPGKLPTKKVAFSY